MAPGLHAKQIRLGGPSVPHPSQVLKNKLSCSSTSGGDSSIIGRHRKPIGPVRSTDSVSLF